MIFSEKLIFLSFPDDMVNTAFFLFLFSALGVSNGMRLGFRSSEVLSIKNRIYSSRVTGGENAKEGEFPYQASLQFNGVHFCGGAIISETVVITAAHCVIVSKDITKYEIVAGFVNVTAPGPNVQRTAIKKITPHPLYPGTVGPHDIAVVVVATPFKWTNYVQKILLPSPGYEVEGMTMLTGWGSISRTLVFKLPEVLQKAAVPILSFLDCKGYFYMSPVDEKSNICTGPIFGNLSACSGDSGGPLAKEIQGKNYVVGLVSWGRIPCGTGSPSVYVKVSHYIDFINIHSK